MSGTPLMLAKGSVRTAAGSGALPCETLAGIAIFRELAPDAVETLSRRCRWRRYGAGQTILQCQDEGRDVFFVVHGRVCAIYHSESGREVRFCDLPAGEMFGEFAAIDGEPRSADIISVTDALIASMSADLFWDVLRRYEPVCAATLRRLTLIVRSFQQRVVEFSTLPVRSRVHAELLRLARIGAGPDRTIAVIAPAPTHADIASRISTHREAVTRELNELARAQLIEKRRTALIIRDIVALASMVQETLAEPCWGITFRNAGGGLESERDSSRRLPTSAVPGSVRPTPLLSSGASRGRRF